MRNFGTVIETLVDSGYEFVVRGFFNVEGGNASVSDRHFEWCDCSLMGAGRLEAPCGSCERAPWNFAYAPSGDGDGIYVVAEIQHPDHPEIVYGSFVVFDHKYKIANLVRSEIELERFPKYPIFEALKFASAVELDLGLLSHSGTLYFSDAMASIDPKDAIVDVPRMRGEKAKILCFAEEVSSDPSDWASRLAATQGMNLESAQRTLQIAENSGRAIFETAGREDEYSLPGFVPRVLMALDSSLSAQLQVDPSSSTFDWELLALQFANAVVNSHVQPMHISTIWMNALLAREKDRAAGDAITQEKVKELLFEMWTWAYQGALAGDQDCQNLITANSYKATPDEIADLYRRRGLYKAASEVVTSPIQTRLGGADGLPKSSTGLKTPDAIPAKIVSTSNFCANCGNRFNSDADKFCVECGNSRV